MEKLRVGVVGVGYFGKFHAEKYAALDDVELVGVADADSARAGEMAERYRTRSFHHHSELFDKVQAVSVTVPTPLHYSVAKDFFLHGIDVLLEKPISSTLQEADGLIRLAESRKRVFQIGHLERFNGALSGLEGKIKNPRFIETRRLGPFSGRGIEVDVVLDLMIHDIDILLHLVRSKIKKIEAVGIPILTRTSDIAQAWIEFENGCIASLTASRVSGEKIRKIGIFQSNSVFSIDYPSQTLFISRRGTALETKKSPELLTEEIPVQKTDLLEAEIRSFLQSVRNRKKVRVSGWDGKRALETALQIIRKISDTKKKSKRS